MKVLKKSSTSSKKPRVSDWVVERRRYDKQFHEAEMARLGLTGVTFVLNPLPISQPATLITDHYNQSSGDVNDNVSTESADVSDS